MIIYSFGFLLTHTFHSEFEMCRVIQGLKYGLKKIAIKYKGISCVYK